MDLLPSRRMPAAEIGLVFELLDEVAVGTCVDAPVDVAGIVADGVLSVLAENSDEKPW